MMFRLGDWRRIFGGGIAAALCIGLWIGFSLQAFGQSTTQDESGFEPGIAAAIEHSTGDTDQVATVTPEESEEPGPPTVTLEASEEPGVATVTPELTEEPGVVTVTPEPQEPTVAVAISATPVSTSTAAATSTPLPTPGRLANISTRGWVGVGDEVLIGGFILEGAPADVIIRGIGPDLGRRGVPGVLQDPWLEVYNSKGVVIAKCENWRGCTGAGELGGLAPADDREAALKLRLEPGAYTAILRGERNLTGVALVEVFHAGGDGLLSNISTRGKVRVDDEVMIGGFILQDRPADVIIRAIGPDLERRGVPGALQDPWLQVFDSKGVEIARCESWRTCQGAGELGGLAPMDDREAALKLRLDPGAYTAIVRGEGRTTGIGLVEVFRLR